VSQRDFQLHYLTKVASHDPAKPQIVNQTVVRFGLIALALGHLRKRWSANSKSMHSSFLSAQHSWERVFRPAIYA
jgi:hypothetical protein